MTAAHFAASAGETLPATHAHLASKRPTITVIDALAEQLVGVVENFTHLSIVEPDLVDVTEEILRFADAFEATLREKGITLILELHCRKITAVARIHFGHMLRRLLGHAECSLQRLREDRPKTITLTTLSHDEAILLRFADNGCGDLPDQLPPVTDLGGRIWAETCPKYGTAIHLLLPINL